jgi:mannose-6-phosphate isomerase-like protein (cupin superfamily)
MKHYKINNYSKDPNVYTDCEVEKIEKVWGVEHLIINNQYCVKVMELLPLTQVSLHFHKEKTETFTLISGQMFVETTDLKTGTVSKWHLENPGDCITLFPFTPHTFYTPAEQTEKTYFIESSTKDYSHDSFRLSQSREIS